MLCTKDDLKERLTEIDGTTHDDMLDTIIAGFTAFAETFCGRSLINTGEDITEYYTGGCDYIQLRAYPVVSITSIKESWTYDFDSATALTANTDYRLIGGGDKGLLLRLYCDWCTQPDGVQVIYQGGFTAAGETPGDGETAVPADLREAAIEQCCFIYKHRDDIGLSGVSFEGGNFSKFQSMKLLPIVEQTLTHYRRVTL